MTVDAHDDDFEVDTTDLDNLPDDYDDDLDEDFGLSYDGLTQAEIDAINADDSEDNEDDQDGGESDEDTEGDTTDDSDAGDDVAADNDETDSNGDADTTTQDDDLTQEAVTVAEKRAAIDVEYEAQLAKLDELGAKWDAGEIADGAYNAAKARLDRELKRIEVREAELVTKEDAIAERETSKKEQFQNDWGVAVAGFMERPENKVFVEGSPEFAALDNQIGAIAPSMPPGTPFDVLLNKARQLVANYMTLPEAEKKVDKPVDKTVKPDPETMPSISNMPAVVPNSTDGNKFAHLDKLDGPALERAIADMSEAQQAEYLTQ